MKASVFYRIAAVLLLLFAAGHTFGFRRTDPSWGVETLLASMRSLHFDVQGFQRTYWDFFVGFGLFVTVFLVFAAVLAWQLGGLLPETLGRMRSVRWTFALCFTVITGLSWRYFFLIPLIFSLLITLCLVAAAAIPTKSSTSDVARSQLDKCSPAGIAFAPRGVLAPGDCSMRGRKAAITLFVAATFCAVASWAQTPSAGGSNTTAPNAQNASNVCRIFFQTPKPGSAQAFEAARKKHNQFHGSQKDTWTWNTFEIQTGDNVGTYVTSTCGHSWKDFDDWDKKMGKADAADAAASIGPTVTGGRNGFYVYRADMSLAPPNQPPAPITSVTIYTLHPGAAPDFIEAIKKVNDALSKQADWPKTSGWLQLANGGEAPTFVLLNARQNWGEFAGLPKTPQDVVRETLGKEAGDAIFKAVRESTARLWTEAATYRSDLSYMPAK